MIYRCKCGTIRYGDCRPYKASGERPWMCPKCVNLAQAQARQPTVAHVREVRMKALMIKYKARVAE